MAHPSIAPGMLRIRSLKAIKSCKVHLQMILRSKWEGISVHGGLRTHRRPHHMRSRVFIQTSVCHGCTMNARVTIVCQFHIHHSATIATIDSNGAEVQVVCIIVRVARCCLITQTLLEGQGEVVPCNVFQCISSIAISATWGVAGAVQLVWATTGDTAEAGDTQEESLQCITPSGTSSPCCCGEDFPSPLQWEHSQTEQHMRERCACILHFETLLLRRALMSPPQPKGSTHMWILFVHVTPLEKGHMSLKFCCARTTLHMHGTLQKHFRHAPLRGMICQCPAPWDTDTGETLHLQHA